MSPSSAALPAPHQVSLLTPLPSPVTVLPSPTPPPRASRGLCSGAYEQCGGASWAGPTCCDTGCICTSYGFDQYSQCIPPPGVHSCTREPDAHGPVHMQSDVPMVA